jgi:LPXTG-site transpeptidase (sortase) family protein
MLKNILFILKHKNFWILLFSTTFFVASVLIAWPYFYEIKYQINPPADNIVQYKVSNPELLLPTELKSPDADPEKIKQELAKLEFKDRLATSNRLVIPKIAVDTPIVEGSDLDILLREEGAWREPDSASPSQDGNMVIAGHRFQYLPPNTTTFYNLNKLKTGDKILVYWKEGDVFKDYVYEIYETLTVNPQDTFVRNFNPNNTKEITLYTCGPEVGDNTKRIVVKGKIIS